MEIVQILDSLVGSMEIAKKCKDNSRYRIPKEIQSMLNTVKPIAKANLQCEINDQKFIIVLNEELAFDNITRDMTNGSYNILGKIIRREDNGYNIFESTDLSLFKPEKLDELLGKGLNAAITDELKDMLDAPDKVSVSYGDSIIIIKPIAVFI